MPQTRAQIWGTLKRYLAYTAAGFVVLGGVGAMESSQPPMVGPANAAQTLRNTTSAEALLASGNAAPSWTQRLRFDLTPMIAAVTPTHQSAVRPPAPYYPAPDTSWTKDAVVSEAAPGATPSEAPAETPVKPVTPIVAAAAPLITAPLITTAPELNTLVAPPLPAETVSVEQVADASDSRPAAPEIAPAAPVQPVAETPAAAPAAPAIKEPPASPSLVATLNWVYGDKTEPAPSDVDAQSSEDTASDAAAQASADTTNAETTTTDSDISNADAASADMTNTAQPATDPATPSSVTPLTAFDMNVEMASEKRVIEVRRGDTLFGLLTQAGLSDAEAQAAGHSLADVFSPSDLKVGQEITLNFTTGAGPDGADSGNKLVGLILQPSMERDVKLTRDSEGQFVAASIARPLTERVDRAAGQIDISLFESAREAGVPAGLIGDIIKAFSYDVDFQRDIHEGDSFEVMYERFDNDKGDLAKAGRLLYASLSVGGKPMAIYYFERDGDGEYFTADGVAVRKSLLKTPIDGAKITSGYGMRINPILGYSAMHQGIDFGAPKGTPIFAAGNGVIEEMDQKNGYGNYMKLRHNSTYETAYAHINRFASGLKRGSKVKQGQVIAYVGTTGNSTGPHLHFEIMVNGQHVNPSTVKTVASDKLGGTDLKAFKAEVAAIQDQRRNLINSAEIADQTGGAAPVLDCNRQRGCAN